MLQRRVFLTAAFALATGAAAFADDEDPKAIVEQLYKMSSDPSRTRLGGSVFLDPDVAHRWYSNDLALAIQSNDRREKKKNGLILDFDPITNSQKVEHLAITDERKSESNAVVVASFDDGAGKKSQVRYLFKRERGVWKLDDMTGVRGDDRWDLRGILK